MGNEQNAVVQPLLTIRSNKQFRNTKFQNPKFKQALSIFFVYFLFFFIIKQNRTKQNAVVQLLLSGLCLMFDFCGFLISVLHGTANPNLEGDKVKQSDSNNVPYTTHSIAMHCYVTSKVTVRLGPDWITFSE